MLLKKDLLNGVDEKYIPMLKMVSIADFTKCIAQFSGLSINNIPDDVIKKYLLTWAKNKFRFFQMLNNKLVLDYPITYKEENKDVEAEIKSLMSEFPAYALWLEEFNEVSNNKISTYDVSNNVRHIITRLFPHCQLDGCSLTHFFKHFLQAPDELVTKIGRIWENNEVQGIYTISIDPVDMMLASENPYNWHSCYRLEVYNDCSHADGCLAAILDDSSLITYIWNKEGSFTLYENYDFKKIRYKRMREWISVSPNAKSIYFNKIYPGKTYSNAFEKSLRIICENIVNKNAVWSLDMNSQCYRLYPYGYNEFSDARIYSIKEEKQLRNSWEVYNYPITCPCGCEQTLPGSDCDSNDDENWIYNGEGFIAENFEAENSDSYWCDYIDDYCENDGIDCADCPHWNEHHPVCELSNNEVVCYTAEEAQREDKFDPTESNVVSCGHHCEGCFFYKLHHQGEETTEENDNTEINTSTVNYENYTITYTN